VRPGISAGPFGADSRATVISAARDRRPLFGHQPPGQHPVGARVVAGVAVGVALQVILVLWLRLPEVSHRFDFGHDLARPKARSVDVCDGVLDYPLLLIVDIRLAKNRTVCPAH
jgi:hypothetical protein